MCLNVERDLPIRIATCQKSLQIIGREQNIVSLAGAVFDFVVQNCLGSKAEFFKNRSCSGSIQGHTRRYVSLGSNPALSFLLTEQLFRPNTLRPGA